jgi:hypothetical protein
MDIRPYIKVKKVTSGLVEDSAFYSGVFFTKNIVHKRMRASIKFGFSLN